MSFQKLTNRNNNWFHYNNASQTVFIFVHGFLSNSSTCWKGKAGTFWPDLIKSDARFGDCSIFLGGYYTGYDSGEYSIRDCAKELYAALKRKDDQGTSCPLSKPNLVFVCHSLGGVVTRYMLSSNEADFRGKKIGLCLMASPSLGSVYANTLSALIRFYKNRVGKQLRPDSDVLKDLDGRFIDFLDKRDAGSFIGAEAIEHKAMLSLPLLPGFKPIVSNTSAGRYFAERRTLPGTDHSTIVKPDSTNHPSHTFLVDFYTNRYVSQPNASTKIQSPALSASNDRRESRTNVLFEAYEASFESFYIERSFDTLIENSVDLHNIWIYGESGNGKTCATKRYICRNHHHPISVTLSQLTGGATRSDIIKEIIETAIQLELTKETSDRSFNALVGILSSIASTEDGVALVVDEVPSGPTDEFTSSELLETLHDLSIAVAGRSRKIRMSICSICRPIFPNSINRAKCAEQFSFLEATGWNTVDLKRLISRIITELPELKLNSEDELVLLSNCSGSPRFVKAFFRTLWVHRMDGFSAAQAMVVTREKLAK